MPWNPNLQCSHTELLAVSLALTQSTLCALIHARRTLPHDRALTQVPPGLDAHRNHRRKDSRRSDHALGTPRQTIGNL